jgi:hypothetical protein
MNMPLRTDRVYSWIIDGSPLQYSVLQSRTLSVDRLSKPNQPMVGVVYEYDDYSHRCGADVASAYPQSLPLQP